MDDILLVIVLGIISFLVLLVAVIGQPYSDREIESKKKSLINDSYNKRFRK